MIALAFAVSACGPTDARPGPDAGTLPDTDAGTDAGTTMDAGVQCGTYEHETDGGCAQEVTWTKLPLGGPSARDHHMTFIFEAGGKKYLGVAGGYRQSPPAIFSEVMVTELLGDGEVGPWKTTTPLPRGIAGGGVAVVAGRVYIAGGKANINSAPVAVNTVYSAPVNSDGTLGAWRTEAAFAGARFHNPLMARGEDLYIVGGTPDLPVVLSTVLHARIGADGAITAWEEVTSIPDGRTHHASIVHGDALYVIGGIPDYTDVSDEILRAPINTDGSLGEWEFAGTITDPPVTHSAFVLDGYAYVVGGMGAPPGYAVLDTVRRARIDSASGVLGAWETLPGRMPTARAHVHQTPMLDGYIYALGGNIGNHVQTADAHVGALH